MASNPYHYEHRWAVRIRWYQYHISLSRPNATPIRPRPPEIGRAADHRDLVGPAVVLPGRWFENLDIAESKYWKKKMSRRLVLAVGAAAGAAWWYSRRALGSLAAVVRFSLSLPPLPPFLPPFPLSPFPSPFVSIMLLLDAAMPHAPRWLGVQWGWGSGVEVFPGVGVGVGVGEEVASVGHVCLTLCVHTHTLGLPA